MTPNPSIDPVRFALWTLRDRAAQRRLARRSAHRSAHHRPFDNRNWKTRLPLVAWDIPGRKTWRWRQKMSM